MQCRVRLITGLESHPDHAIAIEQMTGFGGVISFEIDGDLWRTAKFVDSVRDPPASARLTIRKIAPMCECSPCHLQSSPEPDGRSKSELSCMDVIAAPHAGQG